MWYLESGTGRVISTKSVNELKKKLGVSKLEKIYIDRNGFRYHAGYYHAASGNVYHMFQFIEIQA